MQINSFPGRFDPLCSATLVLMNRENIPSPTGLTCKPCMGWNLDSGCCRTCFRVSFPGLSSTGDVDTAGAATFDMVYNTSGFGSLANCRWGNFVSYNGNFTWRNTTGIGFDSGGTGYWYFVGLMVGGNLSPFFGTGMPNNYALLSFQFSSSTINTYVDCNGITNPEPGHPSLLKTYTCDSFTCTGGTFNVTFPSLSGCSIGGCCSATGWPSSVTVTGIPCS